MNKEPELTLEGFRQRRNNFHLHFIRGNEDYRQQPHFTEFQQANPELEQRLTDDFTPAWKEVQQFKRNWDEVCELFCPRFYDAYKLMRVYLERDGILFR